MSISKAKLIAAVPPFDDCSADESERVLALADVRDLAASERDRRGGQRPPPRGHRVRGLLHAHEGVPVFRERVTASRSGRARGL